MDDLAVSVTQAFEYCSTHSIPVPLELHARARNAGALKAVGDLAGIQARYHDAVTEALTTYFEGGTVTGPRNAFRIAMTEAFYDAFYLGWQDGGQQPPIDAEALDWLNARITQEGGFIDGLFAQVKELRNETDFDFFAYVTERADGYTRTVTSVYNQALLYARKNQMLTFDGEDGDENHICQSINGTCVQLKGKRHRASWWIAHDLIPYPGNPNYDCGAWRCRHYLRDDSGARVTL